MSTSASIDQGGRQPVAEFFPRPSQFVVVDHFLRPSLLHLAARIVSFHCRRVGREISKDVPPFVPSVEVSETVPKPVNHFACIRRIDLFASGSARGQLRVEKFFVARSQSIAP